MPFTVLSGFHILLLRILQLCNGAVGCTRIVSVMKLYLQAACELTSDRVPPVWTGARRTGGVRKLEMRAGDTSEKV